MNRTVRTVSLLGLALQLVVTGLSPAGAMPGPATPSAITPSASLVTAGDSRGRLWRAWVFDGRLLAAGSADGGRTFGPPQAVSAPGEAVLAAGENRPALHLSPDGVVVVYSTSENRFGSRLRLSTSVDGGRHFSAPVTVNGGRLGTGHAYAVPGMGPDGRAFVAWLDAGDGGADTAGGLKPRGSSLFFSEIDIARGGAPTTTLLARPTCECCRLSLATDTDGRPVVAGRFLFGGARDIGLVKAGPGGGLRRATDDDWRIDACPHQGPALSIDRGAQTPGRYHLSWFTAGARRQGLFYAYSDDQGQTFSAPMPVGGPAARQAEVRAENGRVALAWLEPAAENDAPANAPGGPGPRPNGFPAHGAVGHGAGGHGFAGDAVRLVAMTSEDGGASWTAPRQIALAAGAAGAPHLLTGRGRWLVAWDTPAGPGLHPLPAGGPVVAARAPTPRAPALPALDRLMP